MKIKLKKSGMRRGSGNNLRAENELFTGGRLFIWRIKLNIHRGSAGKYATKDYFSSSRLQKTLTNKQTDKQADRQTNRQTNGRTKENTVASQTCRTEYLRRHKFGS